MSESAALFACTRCHTRHPFSELSASQQLCKKCRTKYPVVKCTYCRAEFQENKSGTTQVCRKCTHNVKNYGKPTACEYCKMMAAFIGKKCQRCTNAERKWGLPRNCEQCKLQCCFDRSEESRKKVDGKTLCWLCTVTYRRLLAKQRGLDSQNNTPTLTSDKSSNNEKKKSDGSNHQRSNEKAKEKSSKDPDWVKAKTEAMTEKTEKKTEKKSSDSEDQNSRKRDLKRSESDSAAKKTRLDKSTSNGLAGTPNKLSSDSSSTIDLASTDNNIIALTQLKEKVESLKKQLSLKDKQILDKDKKITELKAEHYEAEKILLGKLTKQQNESSSAIGQLQGKNRDLQRQIATLSKQAGKKTVSPNS